METDKVDRLHHSSPFGLIVEMSIPATIGILSYSLYNVVDMIFITRGVGPLAAGALSITLPMFIILSAISTTIGTGAASIISRALGNDNLNKATKAAANTFLVFWFCALLMTVLGIVFLERILMFVGVTEELMVYARDYGRIILMGAVTSTGFSSLIRAEGSSRYAMFQWVVPVVVNLFLDWLFIFPLQMGVKGAAYATVASQIVSVSFFVIYFFVGKRSCLHLKGSDFIPAWKVLCEMFTVGLPSLLHMVGQAFMLVVINNYLRNLGDSYVISAYGIANKIYLFLIIPIQGLNQGIQPIIGYNYGAGLFHRTRKTVILAGIIASVYSIIAGLALFISARMWFGLFTSDNIIVDIGETILRILSYVVAIYGIQGIVTTYFQSIGKSHIATFFAFCQSLFFFVPVLKLATATLGLDGVWYAMPISGIMTLGLSLTVLVFHFVELKKRQVKIHG